MSPREEKKERTRAALAAAAVELFTQHGYDAVTMAEVAAAAGVSRRTAFRYFASKDDLVMEYPNQWMTVFDASVAANKHLPTSGRLRQASYAVAAHIESDPEPVIQLLGLAFTHPALAARYAANSHSWVVRVAAEISPEPNPDTDLVVAVLAASYMGVVDSVCAIWARTGGSMKDLLDAGFAALEDGLSALDQ